MTDSKAERINSIENTLTRDELFRRLPEIKFIRDEDIREATVQAFLDGCPDYFWEEPTSSSGKYHAVDERGDHGNWLHTKRVFSIFDDLSHSWSEMGKLTDRERDLGRAAALLHDVWKYGWPSKKGEHTVDYHDVIGAEFIEHNTDLPDKVAGAVRAHAGPWQQGREPETDLEHLIHIADMVAARENIYEVEATEELTSILDERNIKDSG